jgi:Uma2 family endonuclease
VFLAEALDPPGNEVAGKCQRVIELLQTAMKREQDSTGRIGPFTSRAYAQLGLCYQLFGHHRKASGAYDQAVELMPTDAAVRVARGVFRFATNQDAGIEDFDRVVRSFSPRWKLRMTILPKLSLTWSWAAAPRHIAKHRGSGYIYSGNECLFGSYAMATVTSPPTSFPFSQEWKDVLEEILPRQGEWSEEEYLVLTNHRNRLVEFTDGFLEVLPMPTAKHQMLLKFLFLVFFNFFESQGGLVLFAPLRLRIRPGKFREPDLLVLLSATDPRNQNQYWEGADLALEVVSEDKPVRDLVDKRGDYAEGRVPEYWIVNPQTESITVLRLHGITYEEAGIYRRGESATSILRPAFSVGVGEVFDAGRIQ